MDIDQQIPIHQYLEIAWRRKWWIAAPVLLSLLVSGALILFLPKVYRSSTTILVEAQKVPEDYVKSAVTGSIEDRLTTIQQQILSRTLLEKIIAEFGLIKEAATSGIREDVVNSMRKRIEIRTVGNNRNIDAFTVSYEGRNPAEVMNIANKLASLFIEENLKIREQLVEGTSDFLENELKNLKETLTKQEEMISGYKRQHMGELPQQLEANLRTLDRYQMELQTVTTDLKIAEDRKMSLESALAGRTSNSAVGVSGVPLGLETRSDYMTLAGMKQQLERLRGEYKENYPDIVELRNRISKLEKSLSETSASKTGEAGSVPPLDPSAPLDVPPQDLVLYRDLQRQLRDVALEASSLRDRRQNILAQIKLYERRVESSPVREQQMMILMRDYDNTKKNYQSLLDKKLNARISENLEKRQKGEQFRILDSAPLPERPVKPDPPRLLGWGMLTGLGIAFGLVMLIESMDTSFKRPEELEGILGFPVLVSIPRFRSPKKVRMEIIGPTGRAKGSRRIIP